MLQPHINFLISPSSCSWDASPSKATSGDYFFRHHRRILSTSNHHPSSASPTSHHLLHLLFSPAAKNEPQSRTTIFFLAAGTCNSDDHHNGWSGVPPPPLPSPSPSVLLPSRIRWTSGPSSSPCRVCFPPTKEHHRARPSSAVFSGQGRCSRQPTLHITGLFLRFPAVRSWFPLCESGQHLLLHFGLSTTLTGGTDLFFSFNFFLFSFFLFLWLFI
jgi:hypothetical protein